MPDIAVDIFVRTSSGGTTLNYADILLSIANRGQKGKMQGQDRNTWLS
jgi:hypothetical protein